MPAYSKEIVFCRFMEQLKKDIETSWSHSKYNEDLLQFYRTYHLTFQTILLGIGSAICVFILDKNELSSGIYFSTLILLSLAGLSFYFTWGMKTIIKKREKDVRYWQHNVLLLEKKLQNQDRDYTTFVVVNRNPPLDENEKIEKIENFKIETREKTRGILDLLLFQSFVVVWIGFALLVLIYLVSLATK